MSQQFKEFALHHSFISTEAISVHLPNANMLVNFSGMVDKFKDLLSKELPELSGNIANKTKTDISRNTLAEIVKVPYKSFKLITVAVPPGLKVDFLTYSNDLLKIQKLTQDLYIDILIPFGKVINTVISSPELSSNTSADLDFKIPDIKQLKKILQNDFKGTVTMQPYWSAVRRQNDVIATIDNLMTLHIGVAKQPNDLILKKINELSGGLNTISTMMSTDSSGLNVTSKLLSSLSDITYSIAEVVSFYSTLVYSINDLSQHMEMLVDTVKVSDLLKK